MEKDGSLLLYGGMTWRCEMKRDGVNVTGRKAVEGRKRITNILGREIAVYLKEGSVIGWVRQEENDRSRFLI